MEPRISPESAPERTGASSAKSIRDVSAAHQHWWAKPLVSAQPDSQTLVEMVYDPVATTTALCAFARGQCRYLDRLEINGRTHVPYSPHNNLIRNQIVLFPARAEEYKSLDDLIAEIQAFIHRYVDISPEFEEVAAHYVLLTWVYDAFNELPYLRVRGDYGSGKTRFLLTVGSLCYKPIFASGASTVSPIFRILDTFRGTLIVDESDFRLSDERAELVKILNNGNARGFPVLRTEVSRDREFNPAAYTVFGPKIVAMRGFFDDPAVESRFLTEDMGLAPLRDNVPINLPGIQQEEARLLRGKLLMYRFRSRHNVHVLDHLIQKTLEPRLNQIFVPLLSVIPNPEVCTRLQALARRYQADAISKRGLAVEGQVLTVIQTLLASGERTLTVKAVTDRFTAQYGEEYERRITCRWIGNVIRRRLNLKTYKSNGVYAILLPEQMILDALYQRYGLLSNPAETGRTS